VNQLKTLKPTSPDISWIRYNSLCSRHDCRDCYIYSKRQFVPGSSLAKC